MVQNKMDDAPKDVVEEAIEQAKPILGNLTFGAVMGYCSGIALQKVGKALAIVVGLGFMSLQTAASLGYIQVDWDKIRIDCVSRIDVNADRQITHHDIKQWWNKFQTLMMHRVPSVGGFSLGFLYGVRYG
jgi:uncharacterized membrane protein (Fun14 family)